MAEQGLEEVTFGSGLGRAFTTNVLKGRGTWKKKIILKRLSRVFYCLISKVTPTFKGIANEAVQDTIP